MRRSAFVVLVLLVSTALSSLSGSRAMSLDRTKFKGDLRLRYQFDRSKVEADADSDPRHRERIRFRFGFMTETGDRLSVTMRLASGSDDPRSTNQTLEDLFSTKAIHLDEAYFAWEPVVGLTVKGGKFGKPIRLLDDLLWDSDLTFEGQAARLDLPLGGDNAVLINGGAFILDELKSEGSDPHLFIVQPGVEVRLEDGFEAGVFLAYYGFAHVKGADLEYSAGGNSREATPGSLADTGLKYDYDSINPTISIARTWGTDKDREYCAGFVGDMVYNPDSKDTGYLLGFTIRRSSVKRTGAWELHYNWRRLEADAFPDVFPDSDFYGGATNVSGHEVILNHAIGAGAVLGVDYYRAKRIEGDGDAHDLLQLDLVVKF